jgi:hypothetical protein
MAIKKKEKVIEKLDRLNACDLDCYKEQIRTIAEFTPFCLEAGIISFDVFEKIKDMGKNNLLPDWITDIGDDYCVMENTVFFLKETDKKIDCIINRNYPDEKFIKENLENDLHNKIRKMVFKYTVLNGKYISEEDEVYEAKSSVG